MPSPTPLVHVTVFAAPFAHWVPALGWVMTKSGGQRVSERMRDGDGTGLTVCVYDGETPGEEQTEETGWDEREDVHRGRSDSWYTRLSRRMCVVVVVGVGAGQSGGGDYRPSEEASGMVCK
jgi:hypothetical protein